MPEPVPSLPLRFKAGVDLHGLRWQVLTCLHRIVLPAYARAGASEVVVTSANDRRHSLTSLHYAGAAVDLRIWGIRDPHALAQEISALAGRDYDCIAESDHLHLEWQPRRPPDTL